MKKTVIVTPLFPPDVGGPATQAFYLAQFLKKDNLPCEVLTYSSYGATYGRWGHVVFFKKMISTITSSDTVVVFDELALGFFASVAVWFRRARLLVRVGGDRLWERFASESGAPLRTLPDFYARGEDKRVYPIFYAIRKFVFRRANGLLFSSVWYRDILARYGALEADKTFIIKNKWQERLPDFESNPLEDDEDPIPDRYTFVYAGRFSKVKNVPFLVEAFSMLAEHNKEVTLLLFGAGPEEKNIRDKVAALPVMIKNRIFIKGTQTQKETFSLLTKSDVCVLPSLSDISPNFLLECQSLGKRAVATKEIGIADDLRGVLYADSTNLVSFTEALENSLKEANNQTSGINYATSDASQKWEEGWRKILGV